MSLSVSAAIHPLKPKPYGRTAGVLAGASFASLLVFAVLFPNMELAGGIEVGPISFSLGVACTVVSSLCFIKCPRRCYTSKLLTFLFLLPVLHFAVQIGIVVVGRLFDPSFGHC
jgi:hypothetical protein